MTYPGSKQPLVDYDAPPAGATYLDALLGEPYKTLNYRGVATDFYSIGSLARALNRSPVTIRKWESKGVIPQPDVADPAHARVLGGQVRLYTREQIAGLRRIAAEEGILDETWKAVRHTNFTERAYELFKEDQ